MILITGLLFMYFFAAGAIFRDMTDEIKIGVWPFIGAFTLSILWIPFFIWVVVNLYSNTTRRWYERFSRTIFYSKTKGGENNNG